MKELIRMPGPIAQRFAVYLGKAEENDEALGYWRLKAVKPTTALGADSGQIHVVLRDINNIPLYAVEVAFTWDTGEYFPIDPNFIWRPPRPRQGIIVPTRADGGIECVLGSMNEPNEPGGINVYIADPTSPSDVVFGAGMVEPGHTSLWLEYQYKPVNEISLDDRVTALETAVFMGGI